MAGALDPNAALLTGIAHRFALALAVLVTDQQLTSESDVPFEPFTAAFDADRRVTAASLREALGFDDSRQVAMSSADSFFEQAIASAHDAGDARGEQAYAVLELAMRRALGRLRQARVRGDGVVEVPFFLFGRLGGGPLVGLRSVAIET
jgi:hypothetical protein